MGLERRLAALAQSDELFLGEQIELRRELGIGRVPVASPVSSDTAAMTRGNFVEILRFGNDIAFPQPTFYCE